MKNKPFYFYVVTSLLFLTLVPNNSNAATFSPKTPQELVESILAANSTPDPDIIELQKDTNYEFTNSYCAIDDEFSCYLDMENAQSTDRALPIITTTINIVGNGATLTRSKKAAIGSEIHGNNIYGLIEVGSGGALTISNLTIQNGESVLGAALLIRDKGLVELNNSILRNNSSSKEGGAIANYGTFVADKVIFENNTCGKDLTNTNGGAIAALGGTTTIKNSGLIANFSENGGAIYASGNSVVVSIQESVIANNVATQQGSGVHAINGAKVNIINTTLTRNESGAANSAAISTLSGAKTSVTHSTIVNNSKYGIYVLPRGVVEISHSILLNNTEKDCFGTIQSNGYNIVGDNDCKVSERKYANTDISGLAKNILRSLVWNKEGAPNEMYYPLTSTSSAINSSRCVGTRGIANPIDQLGRKRDLHCDRGAIESICGDGLLHEILEETCDDANIERGDGCSDKCKVEAGYTCVGEPSVCTKDKDDEPKGGGGDDGSTDPVDGSGSGPVDVINQTPENPVAAPSDFLGLAIQGHGCSCTLCYDTK